jgi:hypothetical protein
VGSGDFLRLALEDRHRKSTAGAHRERLTDALCYAA